MVEQSTPASFKAELSRLASGKMRMCGAADVRMFKRVNCVEILQGLSADVMGKMRRCGYVITLSSRISCFLLLLQYLEKGIHVPTSSSP